MMRVRLFNTFEPVVPLFRDVGRALSDLGVDVEVVVSGASYRPGRSPVRETLPSAVRVRRLPSIELGVTRLARLFVNLSYVIGVVILTLFGRRADVNIVLSQPPLLASWFRVLRSLRGQVYVCHVMDLYPELLVAAGAIDRGGMAERIAGRLNHGALRNADATVAIGRCMQERLAAIGIEPDRLHLIPNWFDPETLETPPRSRNGLRKSLDVGDETIVLYAGNLGVSHRFDDLLEVAASMNQDTFVRFVIIGAGVRLAEVRERMAEERFDNLEILGFQPEEQLPEVLGLGDVHYVSLLDDFTGLVVPSKAYSAFAAGRPVIYQGREDGEIARLIEEHEVGFVVPNGQPQELRAAVSEMVSNEAMRLEMGRRARRLAHAVAEEGPRRYGALITQLVDQPLPRSRAAS